jgi:hypothetical protein
MTAGESAKRHLNLPFRSSIFLGLASLIVIFTAHLSADQKCSYISELRLNWLRRRVVDLLRPSHSQALDSPKGLWDK